MIKLKNLLFEASITGQSKNSEELGGYKGFFKLSEMEAYKRWLKKTLRVELIEGINDKGILKAVFLAGGPGSGKTYVAKQIFGIPEKFNLSMSGMKMVNSDKELKYLLKKYGFGTDLDKMPDEVFKNLTGDGPDSSGLRNFAKELTKERERLYRNGRLGMIIDGTGHNLSKIQSKKKELVWRGADTGKGLSNDRLKFVEKYYKKYNVGFSGYVQNSNLAEFSDYYKSVFLKKELNLTEITRFKYVMILEGNDKSSSLNWVLNSNCVPLMKKPCWHSWLCEPFLIPNYHYIELKDDFSDLEEKLQWLRENDDKAKEIAYNGIKYIETNFSNLKREFYLEKKMVEIIEPHLSD